MKNPKTPRNAGLRLTSIVGKSLALLLLILAASGTALAGGGGPDAPEIDPGSMAGAMTLLTGGVLMLTDRARRRPRG